MFQINTLNSASLIFPPNLLLSDILQSLYWTLIKKQPDVYVYYVSLSGALFVALNGYPKHLTILPLLPLCFRVALLYLSLSQTHVVYVPSTDLHSSCLHYTTSPRHQGPCIARQDHYRSSTVLPVWSHLTTCSSQLQTTRSSELIPEVILSPTLKPSQNPTLHFTMVLLSLCKSCTATNLCRLCAHTI